MRFFITALLFLTSSTVKCVTQNQIGLCMNHEGSNLGAFSFPTRNKAVTKTTNANTSTNRIGVPLLLANRQFVTLSSSLSSLQTTQNFGDDNNRYKSDKCDDLPVFFQQLPEKYDGTQGFSMSTEIVSQIEKVGDKSTTETIIKFLISNTSPIKESNESKNKDMKNGDDNDMKKQKTRCLTSLLTPYDQTNIIRLLGSRSLFYTMLCFLKHLATNLNQSETGKKKNGKGNNSKENSIDNHTNFYKNMQFAYTAAITALSQSPNPKYRMRAILLLDELDQLSIPPNSYVFTAIFLSVDGGKAARELLKRARAYKNIEVDVRLYNSAIYACSRGPLNGWQSALLLFREMPKEGIQPNQQTYASLLQACAKSGQVNVAISLFSEMRNTPSMDKPSPKVWGAVLRACSIAGDWEKAMKLILDMSEEGLGPNIIHMNSVLASLARAGDDMMAFDILNAMQIGQGTDVIRSLLATRLNTELYVSEEGEQCEDQGLPFPDLVSLNTVLTAFAERNNKTEAMKLLRRMKDGEFSSKQGSRWSVVKPDIISYNLVLSTFQEPEHGIELLHEIRMTRKNRYNPLKPTCQTYVNAISICSRSSPPNLDAAISLLRDARVKDGLKPNEFMYSATIWTAERCGDAKAALSILGQMYKDRCKPNTICYNGVLATLAKNGMFKETVLLFHDMKRKHIPSSSITFQQLANAAAKSDLHISTILVDLEKVLLMLNKRERNVEQSGPIYNIVIRGYGSIGKFEDALRVFNSLDQSNALCLSAILFVCSTTTPARWNDALMIIHTSDIVVGAQGPGKVESMALSYAIIACSKENEWEEVMKLLELYGVNGRRPGVTVDAINSVIAAAGRCGRPDIAIRLLNEMNNKYNLQPNERSFRSVIIACNQAEHEKRRQRNKLIFNNVDNNLLENVKTMETTSQLKGDYLSFQWWEAALSLFRRMKENDIKPSIQTYSSVIAACEAAGQWQRAIGILRSMTENQGDTCKPNLYCYNAALAACEKGSAWLEAVELYERMKVEGGSVQPNFISMNSLLIALDKGEQKELAESIYEEALREKILSPWKYTFDSKFSEPVRALDLHQFSIPMAKIAVRNVIESLLKKDSSHNFSKDLIIVLGKGKGSIDGKTKLMPTVRKLLKNEYNISGLVEENNTGRIRIQNEVLKYFVERRQWQ